MRDGQPSLGDSSSAAAGAAAENPSRSALCPGLGGPSVEDSLRQDGSGCPGERRWKRLDR
jgi:hypothetical protein